MMSRSLLIVATPQSTVVERCVKIIRLFCRIWSLLQGSFAIETYKFQEPTNLVNGSRTAKKQAKLQLTQHTATRCNTLQHALHIYPLSEKHTYVHIYISTRSHIHTHKSIVVEERNTGASLHSLVLHYNCHTHIFTYICTHIYQDTYAM